MITMLFGMKNHLLKGGIDMYAYYRGIALGLWVMAMVLCTSCSTNHTDDTTSATQSGSEDVPSTTAPYWEACQDQDVYNIGAGMADITGPFTDISCGYNEPGVEMQGMIMRLYSRTFIIQDPCSGNSIVLVTADVLHLYDSITIGVVRRLAEEGYGNLYNAQNIMINGTHTHAAPSNISWHTMFNAYNGVIGFDPLHYEIVIQGIVESIKKAHAALQPGKIRITQGSVDNTEILSSGDVISIPRNRSLLAYAANLDKGGYGSDADNTMVLLRFDALDGQPIGMLNWFACHGTALSMNNHLMSGDAKGFSAYRFEQDQGNGFVAAFAQGPMGDATPNQPQADITLPFKRPMDIDAALTDQDNPLVYGIIQYKAARKLYDNATVYLHGGIYARYSHPDFNDLEVDPSYLTSNTLSYDNIKDATTCVACLGLAILAGDEEGAPVDYANEGEIKNTFDPVTGEEHTFDYGTFIQEGGVASLIGIGIPVLDLILQGNLLYGECQKEKVVLLPLGKVSLSWWPQNDIPWVPTVLPLQVFVVGDLAIVSSPFELTTMAGRRVKAQVMKTLEPMGITTLVNPCITNAYASYCATREEYAQQNFEGAFTLWGPFQEAAYRQEVDRLAYDLVTGKASKAGPKMADLSDNQLLLTPISRSELRNDADGYGKLLQDVAESYQTGRDEVRVVFQGAHPRSMLELKAQGTLGNYVSEPYTFIEVQQQTETEAWKTIATDRDPSTNFIFNDEGKDISEATIVWRLKGYSLPTVQPGTYRMVYHGIAKTKQGYQAFTSYSRSFEVVSGS